MRKINFLGLFIIRYSGLVLLFLSYLLIAKKMEVSEYGKVMFAIFMANIISLLRFGSHTGYVNYFFNKRLWNNDYLKDSYMFGSFLHLFFILLVFFFFDKIFNLDLNYALIIFGIMLPYYIIEPILRVRDLLLIISIDKLILSICFFIIYWQYSNIDASIFVNYYALAYGLYYLLLFTKYSSLLKINLRKNKLKKYFLLIKEGFLININTVLFSIMQGADLLIIKYFFNAEVLGSYSFAKQLLNGVYYIFTTLALVQNNTIGKLIGKNFELKNILFLCLKEI
jgi:O-antigen/teichoic acid export membrane protein